MTHGISCITPRIVTPIYVHEHTKRKKDHQLFDLSSDRCERRGSTLRLEILVILGATTSGFCLAIFSRSAFLWSKLQACASPCRCIEQNVPPAHLLGAGGSAAAASGAESALIFGVHATGQTSMASTPRATFKQGPVGSGRGRCRARPYFRVVLGLVSSPWRV